MNNDSKILAGFILGALAGAATGLLLAPDKGENTRKKLTQEAEKFTDELMKESEKRLEKIRKEYNQQLDKYAELGKNKLDQVKSSVAQN